MRRDKKNRRIRIPLFILIIAGITLAFAGIAVARYTMQKSESGLIAAKDFYFTSDFLKESTENAEYFVDPAGAISINLYNYADSLRTTPGEITYRVEVVGGSYTDSAAGAIGSSAATAVLTIVPTGNAASVTVTVTSVKPYTKVLTATFKREKGNLVTIEDAEGKRAAVLTMTCADDSKEITIILPPGVIPDKANDNVKSYTTGTPDKCVFNSPGYGVYSLILLKSDSNKNLTVSSGGDFADIITVD